MLSQLSLDPRGRIRIEASFKEGAGSSNALWISEFVGGDMRTSSSLPFNALCILMQALLDRKLSASVMWCRKDAALCVVRFIKPTGTNSSLVSSDSSRTAPTARSSCGEFLVRVRVCVCVCVRARASVIVCVYSH